MFIEVTRQQAISVLLSGRTLWCRETGEGLQLDLECASWKSRAAVRHFLSAFFYQYNYPEYPRLTFGYRSAE